MEDGDLSKITTYQAGVMQAATHRILQKHCDEILKSYGITKMQWLILGSIKDAGPSGIRITDLSFKVGTTLSYLTTTVNLLESKGMLNRLVHSEDNRAKFVSIDPSFMKTSEEIETFLRSKLRETIYSNISPEDFQIYMKVLYQLSQVDKP